MTFWQTVKTGAKKTRNYLTGYDWFGIPITVNYKGEDTYKTFFGFICSFMVAVLMMAYTYQSLIRLVNRDEPDRSSYKLVKSRPKVD